MRRSVFEQIGQNQARSRSQDTGPVVSECVQKSSGQRGPKKRPIYRLWEYATWRIRMRAWCNQIKAALLREGNDPDQPQTYRVIQAASCPIDSQSTWLSWWEGEAIPRPSHIAAAERLVPHSREFLDLAEMRTCLSRHLFALDVLNTKFRVSGRPVDYRRAQAGRLLTGLNESWISFLDTSVPPKSSRHNVLNQAGQLRGGICSTRLKFPLSGLPGVKDLGITVRVGRSPRMRCSSTTGSNPSAFSDSLPHSQGRAVSSTRS